MTKPNTFEIIEANLIALLNARDMKALAIIKAIYEPSIIGAIQYFNKTSEEIQRIYDLAVTDTFKRSYHFVSLFEYFNFLFVKIADVIGPTKDNEGKILLPYFEFSTLKTLKTEFREIFARRNDYAQRCYHRKDVFDMQLFEERTVEGKNILREILWCEVALQCWSIIKLIKNCSSIEAMKDAILITDEIFEELFKVENKFRGLTTLETIKDALFNEAKSRCPNV